MFLILVYLEVILIIFGIIGFVFIRGYIYIYSWGNWQRDEPANTLFFLGLWGQFVNISGGGWPKVYILGVRLNFFGNTYILIIIFEKSICLEPS